MKSLSCVPWKILKKNSLFSSFVCFSSSSKAFQREIHFNHQSSQILSKGVSLFGKGDASRVERFSVLIFYSLNLFFFFLIPFSLCLFGYVSMVPDLQLKSNPLRRCPKCVFLGPLPPAKGTYPELQRHRNNKYKHCLF